MKSPSSLPAEIQTFGYKNFQTDLSGMILFPCFNLMFIHKAQGATSKDSCLLKFG